MTQAAESSGPMGRGLPAGARLPSRRELALIVGWWLCVSPMWGLSLYVSSRVFAPRAIGVGTAGLLGTADALVWAALSVAALAAARAFPLEGGRLVRVGVLHLVLGIALVAGRNLAVHAVYQWGIPTRAAVSIPLRAALGIPSDLVVYTLILSAAYGYEYFTRYRERQLAAVNLEHELTRTQLQMLKAQLQPHFLFNSLHAITTLVYRDPARAEHMIASLSELLRRSLTSQQTQEVTLREEIGSLEPYLEIEKMRFGDRMQVRYAVAPECLDAQVPHLVLQPLVENAIRHGLAPQRRSGVIDIAAERAGGRLHLAIRDNGRGFAGGERPGGIGLANTRARLAHLYGPAHEFRVESAPDAGTSIRISIPFRPAPRAGALAESQTVGPATLPRR